VRGLFEQVPDLDFKITNPYVELTYRGPPYRPLRYDEEEQPAPWDKSRPKSDPLPRYSSGQYSLNRMLSYLEERKEEGHGQTLMFDQPEDGVSPFRRPAMVHYLSEYAFGNSIQLIIATHEMGFTNVEGAKIICLEDKPAQVYDGGKFDITPYLKSVKSLKEGLF